MLFGFLSSLRAIQVLSLVKVVSSGSSIPTEGPSGFPRRDSSSCPVSSFKGNSCFTCVVLLTASIREACRFLKQTALSLLSIQGPVSNGGLVLALHLAQGQTLLCKWHWVLLAASLSAFGLPLELDVRTA